MRVIPAYEPGSSKNLSSILWNNYFLSLSKEYYDVTPRLRSENIILDSGLRRNDKHAVQNDKRIGGI